VRVDVQHRSPLSRRGGGQALEAVGMLHDSQPDRVPTMLRNETGDHTAGVVGG